MSTPIEVGISVGIDGAAGVTIDRLLPVESYSYAEVELPAWPRKEWESGEGTSLNVSNAVLEAAKENDLDLSRVDGTGSDRDVVMADIDRLVDEAEKSLPDALPENAASVKFLLLTSSAYDSKISCSLTAEGTNGDSRTYFGLDQPLLLFGERALDRLRGEAQQEVIVMNRSEQPVLLRLWVGQDTGSNGS